MYESVSIEIENDDRDEWEEQLKKHMLSQYIEDIWEMDDYKTVIEFETNDTEYLLATLQVIGDRYVMWYEVSE